MPKIIPDNNAAGRGVAIDPCFVATNLQDIETAVDICAVNVNSKILKMDTRERTLITVETAVQAPIKKVWEYWTMPAHITKWNYASDEWHCPWARNDLRPGGSFSCRMEAKDGSMGFDFGGVYDVVKPQEYIEYVIGDGRKVKVIFRAKGNITGVSETFEAESLNSVDLQRGGWQAILDNFRKYTEAN